MFSIRELGRVDERGFLLLWRKAGRLGRLTAGFLCMFQFHLAGKFDQGIQGVHTYIIEQIF